MRYGPPLSRDQIRSSLSRFTTLPMSTSDKDEPAVLLDQLLESRTHYRHVWYVRRQRAAEYWYEAQEVHQGQSLDAARPIYARSAKMYVQAIRRRPHFRVVYKRWSFDFFLYRTPPLLFLNAADAHRWAGHRLRAAWYGFRGRRRRDQWFGRAHRPFKRHKWRKAAEYFAHVAIVGPDMQRTMARTFEAIALKQVGQTHQAEEVWRETLAKDPGALGWRALAVLDPSYRLEPGDLPGDEPTASDEVNALVEKLVRERGGRW